MIQGALDADGRIAAKNAVKIRAALHQVTDFKRVFQKYQETHPQPSDNQAQDRARARSWVMLNVYLNDEALDASIKRAWAEAYVLGQVAAGEWIKKTRELQKADDGPINWDNWQPGDKATALLLNPTGGFAKFLEQSGGASFFKKFDKETVENLGTALSDSIELGLDAEHAAIMIGKHVASPARALTIAITEQNRAMSFGSIQRYKEAELEKMEWHVSDPCDKCAQNSGQVVVIGQSFNSGQAQPPAHPHCRCVLLPVIPGMEEEAPVPGATVVPTPPTVPAFRTPKQQIEDAVAALHAPKPEGEFAARKAYTDMEMRGYEPGNWQVVPRDVMREVAIQNSMRAVRNMTREGVESFFTPNRISKADKLFIEKGVVYKNGRIEVQFSSAGLKVSEADRQMVLDKVDKLQTLNPKDRAVVHIDKNSSSKYGWAYGGKSDLWVTPKVVTEADYGMTERGGFKMPVTDATTQLDYTLTHEWGHLLDDIDNGAQSLQRQVAIGKIQDAFPDEFRSRYSTKNDKEFFAEMFTEYINTNGETPNKMVQAMAKEFGWKAPAPAVAPVKAVAFPKNAPKAKTIEAWDKKEIIEIAKIKDNVAQPTQIWNGPEKQYITTYRQVGDPRLKAILEAQGFTKTPTVVNAAQYEVLAKQGGIKVYRGVTDTTDLTSAQMIEQFKTGDMFVGTGVIGNGVYSGTDLEYVIKYAGDKPENVMEMILSPKAKFIEAKEAEEGARAFAGAFYDAAFGRKYANPELGKIVDAYIEAKGGIPTNTLEAIKFRDELRELGWLYHDPGAYAATHGYDAIKSVDEDGGVFVILNRGAVVVKE